MRPLATETSEHKDALEVSEPGKHRFDVNDRGPSVASMGQSTARLGNLAHGDTMKAQRVEQEAGETLELRMVDEKPVNTRSWVSNSSRKTAASPWGLSLGSAFRLDLFSSTGL